MKSLQLNFIINKSTVRWLQMLNDFERERVCSLAMLEEKLDVTKRTIRTDIKDIKHYFSDTLHLESSSKGYLFKERCTDGYVKKKQQLIKEEGFFQILESILQGKLHSIDIWADKLYMSESTMRRYFQGIAPVLARYELKLTMNPVNFVGQETNIRKFFNDFYYESDVTLHTILPPKALIDLVAEAVAETSVKIENTGVLPIDFFYSVYIAMVRYRKKNYIKLPTYLMDKIKSIKEFELYRIIREKMSVRFHVSIPEEEFIWVYLITVCKRTIVDIEKERLFIEQYTFWPELEEISKIYSRTWADTFKIQQADLSVLMHSFFLSKKINDQIAPVLNLSLPEVKQVGRTHGSYEKNGQFLADVWDKLAINNMYQEDICCALTLYTESIEALYHQPIKRIALILEGNLYVCESIKACFLRYIGQDCDVFFPNINEVSTAFLTEKNIDLVVTNYKAYLNVDVVNKDYLLFKPIPDRRDWLRLVHKIHPKLGQSLGEL